MKKGIELSIDQGVACICLNDPKEKVNKLSTPLMQELRKMLDELQENSDVKLLLFKSEKPGIFIAGADISEIASMQDQKQAEEKAQMGQSIFQQIENMPFPTVAAIHGACLGGGMELALACSFRVASDSSKTQLGLPEVSLGILPGFGGTQRLPRLVGLQNALSLILKGKPVDAKKAYRMKLVDAFFSQEFFEEKLQQFLKRIESEDQRAKIVAARKLKGLMNKALETNKLGHSLVFSQARKNLLKQTKGKYPAPLAALSVIERTFVQNDSEAYRIEAREFGKLAVGDICKNLITLFYTSEKLKKDSGVKGQVELLEIHSAAVLGAGVMGGGIAWLFSYKDIAVRMKDISLDALNKGFQAASKIYGQLVKIRKLKPGQVSVKMNKISGTVDNSGFATSDLVVEAVVENMDVKKQVLKDFESLLRDDALIVTNTSALSVNDMAKALEKPERFAGYHFFNPVNRMPLVEIIPGKKTSKQTTATLVALTKKLGKTPVVVKDCPGFLVNRILIPYMNEAAYLLQEGVDMQRVDHLIADFGMPMGPFVLADEVGIDVGYKVAKILQEGFADRMSVAGILRVLAEDKKLLGKKAGKGFYVHQGKQRVINPDIAQIVSEYRQSAGDSSEHTLVDQDILDRCLLTMVNEAARCLEEKVIASADYLDMAMIMGTGFPPFRGGLLRWADSIGLQQVVTKLGVLNEKFGERFAVCETLVEMAQNQQTFYQS